MLRRLKLNRFGKFTDQVIELGPVTVISGDNEAGKTTIFDALLDSLCKPGGNTKAGRTLLTRYGSERDVEPVFEGDRLSFDASEFLNLYALRSSEIELAMDDRSDWMRRVKARLFSGGIDPNRIRTILEGYSSTDGKLKHNRQLDQIRKEKDLAEAHLAGLRARRNDILLEEEEMHRSTELVRDLEQTVQKKRCEIDALKQQLAREDRVIQRKHLDRMLAFINEGKTLRNRIQGLDTFEQDTTDELDRLQYRIQELQTNQSVKEGTVAAAQTEIDKAKAAKEQLEEKKGGSRSVSELAAQLGERISAFLARPPMAVRMRWNMGLIAVGTVLFVAGLLAAILLDSPPLRIGAFCAGVVSCAVTVLLARTREALPDEHTRSQLLAKVIDDWGNAGYSADDVRCQTLEGFQEALLTKRGEYRELMSRIIDADGRLREAQGRLEREREGLVQAQAQLARQKQETQEWLSRHDCTRRDEYITNVAAFRELRKKLSEWEQELEQHLKQEDCQGQDDLERLCDRKLRTLDEGGIPRHGLTEPEVAKLKREMEQANRNLEELSDRLRKETGNLENRRGRVSGSLGDLPEQTLKVEAQIQGYNRAVAANLLNRKAAQLAAVVFGQIAEDANSVMDELGHDFSRWLGGLIPGDREVMISELDMSTVSITDIAGTVRPVDNLSCGTRACFLLAARFALARRARDGAGLLVLDEPFLALDNVRRTNALAVLRDLHYESGWQIVLLTKDPALVEETRSVFPSDAVQYQDLGAL
jgi:DNA repair exonuclease SbcCD ATPase subunit